MRYKIDKIRSEHLRFLKELKAIQLLISPAAVTPKIAHELARQERRIVELKRRQLEQSCDACKKRVGELRRRFGLRLSTADLLEVLAHLEAVPKGQIVYVSVWNLREWFEKCGEFLPPSGKMPHHAAIAVDPSGQIYEKQPDAPEFRLLEATLFEDMCVLFNLARKAHLESDESETRRQCKERLALFRSTAVAAFNAVEAYLNGLAFDYVFDNRSRLSDSAIEALTEWNTHTQRAKYLTLKEKLLTYQRLTLGVDHAPLQETNCEEMRFLIESAKQLRDAIVHASPAINPVSMELVKQRAIYGIEFSTVERIVDSTVRLVRKIEGVIFPSDERLRPWLHDRGGDGLFPAAAFD
jgi:hypothetical protein